MKTESSVTETSQATATARALIPPLENGDTLTREEFERRYHAMPHVRKAELIEGKVYMPSPVRRKNHCIPENTMAGWLFTYRATTPGVSSGNNGTVRLDETNEPQPDADLRIEERCGGQSFISEDDYLEGAPELVVEIAASSAAYDLREKLKAYQRNGVREYIVWATFDKELYWFDLAAGADVRLAEDEHGVVRSQVFPGLWLNIPALLEDDSAGVLKTLQQGIASAAHQEFVQRLAKAAEENA
ncbi:MAG: Uma2 family endonuclease [Acidobacteria bacterium]|nr:Uma2 family endonuclease [Acidobacteriota bacterium]